jgi:hypothetical protein
MQRCRIGVPRGSNAYDDLHSILAKCYGTLGALDADNARLREALSNLEAMVERCREPGQPRSDAQKAAREVLKGASHE